MTTVAREGPALALDTARRLACDATVVGIVHGQRGEPLDIGRKTRSIPPWLARALRARDGGCRFPGCDRTRFSDGHDIEHWANGGETKLANLITLCGFHHRLVHEGGYGVKRTGDGLARLSDEARSELENHAADEPLRMARREHGLQSGHRGHAVLRAQAC